MPACDLIGQISLPVFVFRIVFLTLYTQVKLLSTLITARGLHSSGIAEPPSPVVKETERGGERVCVCGGGDGQWS